MKLNELGRLLHSDCRELRFQVISENGAKGT